MHDATASTSPEGYTRSVSRYDRARLQFEEAIPSGFVDALADPTAWTPRSYDHLLTTFHALRAASARLRSASSFEPLRALLVFRLEQAANEASTDARFDALTWPSRAARLAQDIAENASPAVLVERLEQLAEGFRSDGHFTLGADVYFSLVASAAHIETGDWIAWLRGAASLTIGAGREERALVLLDWLRAAATMGSERAKCAALTVESAFYAGHGNLPRAEELARLAVEAARGARDADGLSRARYGLGVALGNQNRHDEAAVAFFRAYRAAVGDDFKRWALAGLSHALLNLGRDRSAEDGCRLLLAMQLSIAQRMSVLNTLLCVAARRGDRALFDEVRSAVELRFAAGQLEPQLETTLSSSIGVGFWRFGDSNNARQMWQRGLAVAEANRVNQMTIELEQSLRNGRPPVGVLGPEPLPDIGGRPSRRSGAVARLPRRVERLEALLRSDCERVPLARIEE
ncbi:MAG TPA: hypothetical protein VIP11_05810 [Gemmatimonadaceae bacterium]